MTFEAKPKGGYKGVFHSRTLKRGAASLLRQIPVYLLPFLLYTIDGPPDILSSWQLNK
jgi:hypothetical protein